MRYITERAADPYWRQSMKVKKELWEYRHDIRQPDSLFWRGEWEKIERATEAWEKSEKSKENRRLDFWRKYKHSQYRDVAKKALAIEEEKFSGSR